MRRRSEVINDDEAEKRAEELDKERLNSLMQELKEAIDAREALAKFKDQILLDITPEGVRIQIVDHDRRSMFPLGSAKLEDYSTKILYELANIINNVPNRISISGHTDIKPYVASQLHQLGAVGGSRQRRSPRVDCWRACRRRRSGASWAWRRACCWIAPCPTARSIDASASS